MMKSKNTQVFVLNIEMNKGNFSKGHLLRQEDSKDHTNKCVASLGDRLAELFY